MTDDIKITMDGEWAYRRDPKTKARILCVDKVGDHPVVSTSDGGDVYAHTETGRRFKGFVNGEDLVPLQKSIEGWFVQYEDGTIGSDCKSRNAAEAWANKRRGTRVIKMREVAEDE